MWLFIAITSHFLNAIVFVIDKVILSKAVLKPISYAFYVGLLSGFAIVLIPFGFTLPSANIIILCFLVGAIFVGAVYLFLRALFRNEASAIVPIIGGLVPIFTFLFSFLFLKERLSLKQIFAFLLLVLGGILISIIKKRGNYTVKGLLDGTLAALFFAGGYVLMKYIFLQTSFLNGFVLIGIGRFLSVLLLLLIPFIRKNVFESTTEIFSFKKGAPKSTFYLFTVSKCLAALAATGIDFAIYLASATLVNALQGVQYAFLFILTFIFSKKYPSLKENFEAKIIIQKILAIILIGGGLIILSI